MCAHCVMAGTWPCFLDVSSPNLNGMCPTSFLRSTKTEAAGAAAANQKQQQQQWSVGPRSSASRLSQILDPSPLWKVPSPKEQIHKYKQVTIRHTMGTTQTCVIECYRSIQSTLRHPCGVQFCKGTRFRVDCTQAEST